MPREMDLDISLMSTLYFTMLLVVEPRHMPCELTIWFVGEKINQAVEAIFWVLWLALFMNPI